MNELISVKDNYLTETDKYRLTPTREKVLEAFTDPTLLGVPISERCKLKHISRQAYYNALHDPKFMEIVSKTSVDLVRDKVADVLAASVKAATTGGVRGYQDRRMLLEMFGITAKEGNDNRVIIVNVRE